MEGFAPPPTPSPEFAMSYQRQAVGWEEPGISAKKRDLEDDNGLDTETHDSGEGIEEAEPMEEGSGEREIEGWKKQTRGGFAGGGD